MTAMGAMVYVVDENNAIQPRPVVLGPVLESGQLIKSGLNEGDRVIFTSLIRLRPGMQVKAIEKGAEAHAYSAPTKAPQAEAEEAPEAEATAAESSEPSED
ncbi:MAG: Efflux pump periplasmic linker BepD precursor [Verrucomicrobia bacterium ADurb.Bin474]|nr:MAG: Efflux pump periplasmic linker BepD precursor [Verrucomicrobia bacterium ADurb.Bin474]